MFSGLFETRAPVLSSRALSSVESSRAKHFFPRFVWTFTPTTIHQSSIPLPWSWQRSTLLQRKRKHYKVGKARIHCTTKPVSPFKVLPFNIAEHWRKRVNGIPFNFRYFGALHTGFLVAQFRPGQHLFQPLCWRLGSRNSCHLPFPWNSQSSSDALSSKAYLRYPSSAM